MIELPSDLEKVREAALRAISPILPMEQDSSAPENFLFLAERTCAGQNLAPYYLVYFLLVDLLRFRHSGRGEKVAWSVPIDFNGTAFVIEHRKMGIGVFASDPEQMESQAREIVIRIRKGVKVAQPFFEWLAEEAVKSSKLNVENRSPELFARFEYFLDSYHTAAKKAEKYADRRTATWLALAAIDAFFSWTEHTFIHIALISGAVSEGTEVADLAEADWSVKFKRAFDLSDKHSKIFFDELLEIRRQLRNFIAHGAFGKSGAAFSFHSGAGAVPVLLPHMANKSKFTLYAGLAFEDSKALSVIERFIEHLWSGPRKPAYLCIQESELPTILTFIRDGTYAGAMSSEDSMREFLDYLNHEWDQSADMDW